MLKLEEVYVVRHKVLVEGRSRRQVAEEMGISRNTVRRYLEQSEPKRVEEKERRRPTFELVEAKMVELLEDWRGLTTDKQRITGTRLHKALVNDGKAVGLTLVRDYLREERRKAAEVYVPLVHRAGESAQVDFFDVDVELAGHRRRAYLFVMRLMHSGRDFAWLYERCDQLSFLDGHVRAFAHFGGVPKRSVSDNLKAAVAKIVFPRRQLTARYLALSSHYLFEPSNTRPYQGHDKGGVESRGRGIRLQQLTPIPRGESLGALSAAMLAELDAAEGWRERWAAESAALRPLPPVAFDVSRVLTVRVRKNATVLVEGAIYSVESRWRGLEVTASIGVEEVRFIWEKEVETYERKPRGTTTIRYRHFLTELASKPQALRQVAPELLEEMGEPYRQLWELLVETHGEFDGARSMARVLKVVCEHGEEKVAEAIKFALATRRSGLFQLTVAEPSPRPLHNPVPDSLAGYAVEAARAADYDHFLTPAVARG